MTLLSIGFNDPGRNSGGARCLGVGLVLFFEIFHKLLYGLTIFVW
jgi:hypothetical protein